MYSNRVNIKEFVATSKLTYKGKHMGYQGYLNIRGKRSNVIDITLAFMSKIEENYYITLNTDQLKSNIEMVAKGKTLISKDTIPILTETQVYKVLGFNDYKLNETRLQDKLRVLCDTYYDSKFKNTIVIIDGTVKSTFVKLLGLDAIELHINPVSIKQDEQMALLHGLINIAYESEYIKEYSTFNKYLTMFNELHKTAVPLDLNATKGVLKVNYICTSCKDIKQLKPISSTKNYRCKCGGLIKKEE